MLLIPSCNQRTLAPILTLSSAYLLASAEANKYAEESVKIGAKVLWLQLGIRSIDAKELVESNDIEYIENRCTKMEYQKLFLNINPAFPVLQS